MDQTYKLDFLDTLSSIIKERTRQIEKHGGHDRPDGHASPEFVPLLELVEKLCTIQTERGEESWLMVLTEEYLEAVTERDPAKLEKELIQVATVCAAWVTAIRRRKAAGGGMPTAGEQAAGTHERADQKGLANSGAGSPKKKLRSLPSPYEQAE